MSNRTALHRFISFILCFFIFLIFCIPLSFAEDTKKSVDSLYEDGQQLLSDGSDPQNLAKGIGMIIAAANAGSAKAMVEVGVLYSSGLGRLISNDFEEGTEVDLAYSWYVRGAEAGEPGLAGDALASDAFTYFLGSEDDSVQEDDAAALMYFEKAAEYGNPSAVNMMVAFYIYGFGVEQDYDKALDLSSTLADKGDLEARQAMEEFAYAFYAGNKDGIDISFSSAFKYYEKLTEYGNERAMYNVGLLYEYGLGVSQDHEKAVEWLNKAVDAGYEPAKTMLSDLNKE